MSNTEQKTAEEVWAKLDRALLTHHNLDGGKRQQGVAIIQSAIEKATEAYRELLRAEREWRENHKRAAHASDQGAEELIMRLLETSQDVTIGKFPTEAHLQARKDAVKFLSQLPTPATPSGGGEKWKQWRELLQDGRPRALCWNCGYPELIGSDDCRNCSTNFDPTNRITLQPQVGSALDLLCQAEDYTELTSGFCEKHTPNETKT